MGFQQGLSGLNASSQALGAIGNNVANSGTVGFKSATAQFSDVYAASLQGAGASQIGIGTAVANIAQEFSQGNITSTNNPLDIAINGSGFYRMQNTEGVVTYTRNGQFQVDKNGFIINSAGSQLTGYMANANGVISTSNATPIHVDTSSLSPQATGTGTPATGLVLGLNLDSRKTPPSGSIAASVTGSALGASIDLTAGPAAFDVTINGYSTTALNMQPDPADPTTKIPTDLTVPAGTYTPTSLAAIVQTRINSVLPSGTSVTVAPDATGSLVITAVPGGTGSSVSVNDIGGALMGAGVTSTVVGADAFNPSNPLTYTSTTSGTVYDSLGNPHTLGLYFVKAATPNQYNVYTNLDGGTPTAASTINFSSTGAPTPLTAFTIPQSFTVTTGGSTPLTFNLDLTSSTQYGSVFGVNSIAQDGYASGTLTGLNVSSDGTLQGKYSNGKTRDLAQIVLSTFKNANGLQSVGGNQWQETAASGQPLTGTPGSGINGVLQSKSVEESNTDLTAELVNMITAQRAYQANAQTIKTEDQIMQTLVNLR
ncbi:MAG TPA: flagellar hook protein FlgE [Rhodocyclaceae bacterium]|jgi:flagellar hook protein FlgE